MDGHDGDTKRIELSGEHWAVIRRVPAVTAADIRAQQLGRIKDGRTGYDPLLDTMATFATRIVEWSRGPVDTENIDGLPGEDTLKLVRELLDMTEDATEQLPPLEDSSGGTGAKKARRNRGSGESGD